jgi:hypothetical protein
MISPGSEQVRAVDAYGHDRSVFVMRQERGREYHAGHPPVAHEHLVVAFCTGGTAVIEQQGRWSLAEGDVVLIPAGAPHRHLEEKDSEHWCLGLCPVCFRAEGGGELLEPLERVRSGAAAVVNIRALESRARRSSGTAKAPPVNATRSRVHPVRTKANSSIIGLVASTPNACSRTSHAWQ